MQGTLFQPGRIVATPGVLESTTHEFQMECLARHLKGDWGVLPREDLAANDEAIALGNRILSSYPLDQGGSLWIITESDRSVTTLLLPQEY